MYSPDRAGSVAFSRSTRYSSGVRVRRQSKAAVIIWTDLSFGKTEGSYELAGPGGRPAFKPSRAHTHTPPFQKFRLD